jgi:hypothetical protein
MPRAFSQFQSAINRVLTGRASYASLVRRSRTRASETAFGPFDIGPELLTWAMAESSHAEMLQQLVDLSRSTFGWYSRTITRSFEGPWIVERIGDLPRQRILDIGAGISPVPLLLARDGARVVTIDNHRKLCDPDTENPRKWNDWGFLDYAQFDSRITSRHADVLTADFERRAFTTVYSMSVVEHMTAEVRCAMWPRVHHWLDDAGLLLLTLDLVPGTERLWDLAEGQRVDAQDEHGDLSDVVTELEDAGFRVTKTQVLRDLKSSRTDCALLRISK